MVPEPINPAVLDFIRSKGLPTEGLVPRMLDQVPDWNLSQMLVFLEPGVQESLPEKKCKAVQLHWNLPPRTANAADLASAFETLDANLKELIGAVLEKPRTEIHV